MYGIQFEMRECHWSRGSGAAAEPNRIRSLYFARIRQADRQENGRAALCVRAVADGHILNRRARLSAEVMPGRPAPIGRDVAGAGTDEHDRAANPTEWRCGVIDIGRVAARVDRLADRARVRIPFAQLQWCLLNEERRTRGVRDRDPNFARNCHNVAPFEI